MNLVYGNEETLAIKDPSEVTRAVYPVDSKIRVYRRGPGHSAWVNVDLLHTYVGDLIVSLIHPDGTEFRLHDREGGSSDNLRVSFPVDLGGKETNGTWRLRVVDYAGGDVGVLKDARLYIFY